MGFIPETTIIEFNGLPGVGKSTITQCLENLAKKQEIPFYKTYYRHSFERRAISLIFRPTILKLLPSIMRYAKAYCSKGQIKYMVGFLAYVREYLDFKKEIKRGLLVSDQGIVQDFINCLDGKKLRIKVGRGENKKNALIKTLLIFKIIKKYG